VLGETSTTQLTVLCYKYRASRESTPDEIKKKHLMRGDGMTEFEEKVWGYVRTHKRPVQAKTLARLWIVSDNRVSRALNSLVSSGRVLMERTGNNKFYRVNPLHE
jgi:Fic family protein